MATANPTCEPCRTMFASRANLRLAMSEAGFDLVVDRATFRKSVEGRCGFCVAFLEELQQESLEEIRAQAEYDPDDIEGMDEEDYHSLEPFRILACSHEDDQKTSRATEKLIRNVYLEVPKDRARYDFNSMWVAAWSADNRHHLSMEFEVFARKDDPAGQFVRTRPRNHVVSSDVSFDLAKTWIDRCITEHKYCPKPRPDRILPGRLIDVGSDREPCQLRDTSELSDPEYAALSYVWGGLQPVTLTTGSMKSMRNSINPRTLPQTIQDAITTTRRLGLQYLWNDALCIIQDDDGDKNLEIARMDDIYYNSYVTICAASGTKCQAGFLEDKNSEFPDVTSRPVSILEFLCPDRRLGRIMITPARTYDPIMEPVNTRAWCFQERLLSPRLLTYGSWQMYWQCQSKQDCDGGDVSRFEPVGIERISERVFLQDSPKSGDSLSEQDREEVQQNWLSIAQEYNLRDMTNPQDKLPALAGIAKRFGGVLTGDKYCAGLWRSWLIPSLAWKAGDPQSARPMIYRAPTWSWAAIDGAIQWLPEALLTAETNECAEILSCEVEPLSIEVPYGRVKSGTLILSGKSRGMKWDGSILEDNPSPRWSIHPDIFLFSHESDSGSESPDDTLFGTIPRRRKQIKYHIPTHQSLGDKQQNSSSASNVTKLTTLDVLCVRITDIAALILEKDALRAMKETTNTIINTGNKRRKLSSQVIARSNHAENTNADHEADNRYRRIAIMMFEGPDGSEDADLFFKNAELKVVSIV